MSVSCATISRSMRSAPVGPIPDLQDPVYDSIDIRWRPMARNLATAGRLNPVSGNSVKIYTEGRSKFADFNEDLIGAEQYIDMEYYRFAADSIAGVVKEILLDKADEGVPVRMILESRSNSPRRSFYRQLRKAEGIYTVDVQNPGDIIGGIWNLDFRDHRKIAVIDGRVCYTGGMNIADDYYSKWRDTHLRLEGPIVEDFESIFDDFWTYFGGKDFAWRPHRERIQDESVIMQATSDGPYSLETPIMSAFEEALATAQDYFWIQTPYLCPPPSTLKAMEKAVKRGVDVRLMLPKNQDVPIMLYVNHSFYKKLLKIGVKVYEREDPFIHSKSFITDDYVSCYGSANVDNRSFWLNYENNVYIYDAGVTEEGRQIFLEDLESCTEIKREELHWSLWEKFMQGVVILLGYSQW